MWVRSGKRRAFIYNSVLLSKNRRCRLPKIFSRQQAARKPPFGLWKKKRSVLKKAPNRHGCPSRARPSVGLHGKSGRDEMRVGHTFQILLFGVLLIVLSYEAKTAEQTSYLAQQACSIPQLPSMYKLLPNKRIKHHYEITSGKTPPIFSIK